MKLTQETLHTGDTLRQLDLSKGLALTEQYKWLKEKRKAEPTRRKPKEPISGLLNF